MLRETYFPGDPPLPKLSVASEQPLDRDYLSPVNAAEAAPADNSEIVTQMLAVFEVLAQWLGARLALLLGLGAAAGICWRVLESPSVGALFALAIFCMTVFLPIVALSAKRAA
jgi:hypothetical protein